MNSNHDGPNFLKHLTELENTYNTRPQFIYRLNRFRYDTFLRIPHNISLRPWTGGWVLKGIMAYSVFYLLLRRTPTVPYLNREGYYNYDYGHHTSQMSIQH